MLARLSTLLLLVLFVPQAHAQLSMFSDIKAVGEGDIVTVVLAERTAASRESEWENASKGGVGLEGDASTGGLGGRFGVDAKFQKSGEQRNESIQKDLLSGTMTARVVGVDEAGNLRIAGERRLSVNGESHLLAVSGLVRRYDISQGNSILSYQIADAVIVYKREGGIKRKLFKPGRLARVGGVLAAIVGAIVLAGS